MDEKTKPVGDAGQGGSTPAHQGAERNPGMKPIGSNRRGSSSVGSVLGRARVRGAVLGVVVLVVIAALFVPPVSLLDRLGIIGYETVSAENVAASHADGLTIQVDPESFDGRLRVRLEAIPRLEFLEGSAGADLKAAAQALPEYLEMKSPFYQIETRGEASQPVWVDVALPDDAEPWETLDLYTWDGERWLWLAGDRHAEVAEHEFIRAEVHDVPSSVVVVQAKSREPLVSTYLDPDDDLTHVQQFDVLNPTGLLLGTMGGFAGDLESLAVPEADANTAVVPVLRNWAPGGTVNEGLLADFLNDTEAQEAHVDNILELCAERGFDGVEIDYRGVAPEQRDAYTAFIQTLADALDQADLWLGVAVDRPVSVEGGLDAGGYDLMAIGEVADVVKVPFPADPEAFAEDGAAPRLLDWITARVSRYQLNMLVSSMSATVAEGADEYESISVEEALSPFGQIEALTDLDEVEPETELTFGLTGSLLSTTPQEDAGTYRIRYRNDEGEPHTAWFGTAANLARKLRWAERYNLGGVAVADALDPGNMDGVIDVVASYGTGAQTPSGEPIEVTWSVQDSRRSLDEGTSPLTELTYSWTTPEDAGEFQIGASILGVDHGSVTVTVIEPETITETQTITETETMTETEETEEEGVCLNATFVADVTVPDNTQFEKEEEFDKTWRVRNSGSCDWPEDTLLTFIGGEQLDAPETVEVGALEPNEVVEITVPMKAPAEDGKYTGKWQLASDGQRFGGQFWVTIVAGEPQQAEPTPPPAPPPSGGGSFELGGHIRDWGFPHADRMHYAGMNWAKVQIRYRQDASGIIAASHANGFKIQVSALGPASMVTQPGFEQDIASWVAEMAAAGADAIEIWNEPNINREWQDGHISPQAYTSLLCTAYRAIKNANPSTAVISAAPAPTGYFGGCGPSGCDDQPWLEGMYNAGAAQCMDYIGAHHNAGATSPSATIGHPANPGSTHHSWFFLPQTRLYYNIFRGARKLFYTEMGYVTPEGTCGSGLPSNFQWGNGTSLAEQGAWLSEAVRLSISTGMVRNVIVWNVDYVRNDCSECDPSTTDCDPQASFALIRPDGSCPTCDTLHNVLGTR